MNDVVFLSFSISIAIFLLGMVVMLPSILFSSGSEITKENLIMDNGEVARKERIEKVGSTYRKRHEKLSA